jgi:3-hydroxybutyryl-CoA dehydrogenase
MHIRVIGAGVMGRGIAQWAVVAGHTVELADVRQDSVEDAVRFVGTMLDRAVHKQRLTRAQADSAAARLRPVSSPDAPGDRLDLVVEAVREDLATKSELFTRLEEVLPATTVFATNTSSLSVTRIASTLRDPSRLAGLHFFNPVPLMRIVEVVPAARTRPEIVPALVDLVAATGHRPVVVADSPGFLVNHAGRGLITEALALLEEGVADAPTVDRVARDVLGLRMGPFELTDLTGLDVTASVIESVWSGFQHSERLRPSWLTANRVDAGLHGRKTGRGFYDHGADATTRPAEPEPEPAAGGDQSRLVWADVAGPHAALLRRVLVEAGARVEDGERPSRHAVVLVPTWGTTVAATVAAEGLPRERTLGVDPLSLTTTRRVVALTPATTPAAARDACAVLAGAGHGTPTPRVSLVRDCPGSVAQRLLSSVVSVSASIAERRLASPGDIDAAVTAGLGYPTGPLAWGDRVGAASMLDLQRQLHSTTGDPRYRPTRWLTERVQLGLPLTHAGTAPSDVVPTTDTEENHR